MEKWNVQTILDCLHEWHASSVSTYDLECYGSIFGNRLLIISLSFRKIWDALTGDVLHSFEHKHIVRACAFSEVML